MARDHVAIVVEQWAAERPDLDTSPILVIGRIHRVAAALTPELSRSARGTASARATSTSSRPSGDREPRSR